MMLDQDQDRLSRGIGIQHFRKRLVIVLSKGGDGFNKNFYHNQIPNFSICFAEGLTSDLIHPLPQLSQVGYLQALGFDMIEPFLKRGHFVQPHVCQNENTTDQYFNILSQKRYDEYNEGMFMLCMTKHVYLWTQEFERASLLTCNASGIMICLQTSPWCPMHDNLRR